MPLPDDAQPPVVISLVLRLSDDVVAVETSIAALRARSGVEVGERREAWLPVVAETPSPLELHAWMESLPGVAYVDVTFVEVVPEPEAVSQSGDFS